MVVGAYQRKLEAIAAHPEVDHLTAVVPPSWKEPGGRVIGLERVHTVGYDLRVEPIRFNGKFHVFYWPGLGRVIQETRPDVVHLDEEPYNLATALGTWQARRAGAWPLFFTWQNLLRRYPVPFSLLEQYVLSRSALAIAGNGDAVEVLHAKGYRGPTAVIPQVGIDPSLFCPDGRMPLENATIGYVARLVEEKGPWVLLDALAGLEGEWRLHVVGSGPLAEPLRARVASLGWQERVRWEPSVPSTEMPDRLRGFDVVVLPSLTRPNWKEQFGRVLVEAMACGVPVAGSSCGEIPNVVGDAGVVVPEGDPTALRRALADLLADPARRAALGAAGVERARRLFTHESIAARTVEAYAAATRGAR